MVIIAVRYYSSVAPPTTLTSTINASATSIQVGSTTGFPALVPYTLSLSYDTMGEELVQVNAVGGTTLTVTRGIDGTSATSHNAGAEVRHVTSARDFADSRSHENADQGIHGLDPSDVLVGEDKAQTLANKTLDMATGTLNRIDIFNGPSWVTTINGDASTPNANILELKADPSGDTAMTVGSGGILRLYNNATNEANPTNLKFRLLRDDELSDAYNLNAGGSTTARLSNGVDGHIVQGSADNVRRRAFYVRDLDGATVRGVLYTDGTAFLNSKSAANATLDIRGASGQSAPIFRVQNSATATVYSVDTNGDSTGRIVNATSSVDSPAFRFTGSLAGHNAKPVLRGITNISFTNQTSFTVAVTFPTPFTATPSVVSSINSGDGSAIRWLSRPINVSTTGFTMFVLRGDAADPPATWSNIPVSWIATQ